MVFVFSSEFTFYVGHADLNGIFWEHYFNRMDLILLSNANAERKGFNFVPLCIVAVICQLQKSKPVLYVPLGTVKNLWLIFLNKEPGF